MKRYFGILVFGLATVLLFAATAPSSTATEIEPSSPEGKTILAATEGYFSTLTTARFHFEQTSPIKGLGNQQGEDASGSFSLWRPGRMRFDYSPPSPITLIAAKGKLLYMDRDLNQASELPISSSLLGLFVRPTVRLSGDITVKSIVRDDQTVAVTLYQTANPGLGQVVLNLRLEPRIEWLGWEVTDAQLRVTVVRLSQASYGLVLDNRSFDFNFKPKGNQK
ncbi:MAG: outer membrane lipoprotein carrier protein LolA [Alphaproteobacteria bacterium]|nr:outer membrane lipoprotein carrier protein LolA [Alphaproteobacteria bacterium]